MNNDGSVIVGAAGAQFLANCKATKWVNGVEKQLFTGGIAVQSSVAVFVADSGVIFGYAVLSNGRVVLMRGGQTGIPRCSCRQTVLVSLTSARLTRKATRPAAH